MFHGILNYQILNNQVSTWLFCFTFFAAGVLFVSILKSFVIRHLKAQPVTASTPMGKFLIERIRKTGVPLAYLGIMETTLSILELPSRASRVANFIGIALMAIFLIQFTVTLVRFLLQEYVSRQGENPSRDRALKAISSLLNAIVWVVGILFVLDNLGFKISTVVAGLGIGGIAIALAAQTVLGDLFAYFTILFDRPFEIGDQITVGDYKGTVEHLGIKTTRIAGVGGEQIIVSNKDLTDSRVRNFKRMTRRRVTFNLGVIYDTDMKMLRKIPEIITGIFQEINEVTLDRVHFSSFGDSALVYEIVYYVENNNYTKYMDSQHAINLRIAEEFLKNDIQFAYPTQTLYLRHEELAGKTDT
ncbi:MAG: mechanosensitive ion channel [Syntrophorhabdaceae bacterium]|nr:mechanosensitive ion channel [Syntrophorhabdaceae bacterium]